MNTFPKSVLVMIVDDQLETANATDSRLKIYGAWLEQISDFHLGKWSFDIRYCRDLRAVASIELQPGQLGLAIVDMVLEESAWTTTSVAQLDDKLLAEKWPMILVSARFDSSQAIQRANKLVGKGTTVAPFHFLTWSSISRAVDGHDPNEVAFIIGAVLSRAGGQDIRFKKNLDDPIDLIHLTDLHFGRAYWDVGALITLRQARRKQGLEAADFLAVTGDIADKGIPQQYAQAREYFEALANNHIIVRSESGLPSDRVFVCPGNHDFCRTLALGANMANAPPYIINAAPNPDNSWVRPYAWAPYQNFENEITDSSRSWIIDPGYRLNSRFRSAGILVLELNVERFDIEGYQDGLPEDQLRRSFNDAVAAVEATRANSECLIILAHRHESNVWQPLAQMIQNSLQGLALGGPLIFLCGHEHSAEVVPGLKDRALFVRGVPPNAGPSLPEYVSPMVNSLRLHRNGGAVVGVSVHQFRQGVGGWSLDTDGARSYSYSSGKWRASD